jgi:cytochrome c biogenesis protein CcdA/thiol-disulfide isomerase/thioredoxin
MGAGLQCCRWPSPSPTPARPPPSLPCFGRVALLVLFGFVAGAATAVSPCVLPVLPVALAAGATGGRRRPLGVVTGLVLSFTFATVALVYVLSELGLPDQLFRTLAIVVLGAAGVALIVPNVAARLEAWLSRLAPRAPVRARGDGFGSGLLLGASLGLVYAPCAGPILAAVITVSASQELTGERLAVALAYSAGSGVVLYGLMLGGRRLTAPLARRSLGFQRAMGAVMVSVALLMAAELDIRFENEIAASLPAVLVNPSKDLEEAEAARDNLADLRGGRGGTIAEAAVAKAADESAPAGTSKRLPVLGPAPELRDTQRWFNTRHGRPLSLRSLRGRVVLLDFWTYSCINCIRTLPALKAWDSRYRHDGLTIIGLHAPEFPFERDAGNVERAIGRNGLRYPVAQDNDFATWRAYGNQYWPAKYLVDARGRVRYVHFGEGEYESTERAIRALLAEAGHERLGRLARARVESPAGVATPESYLGSERAARFLNGAIEPGTHDYELPRRAVTALPPHHLAYAGRWRIDPSHATAVGRARLHLRFYASRVFLVLGAGNRPGSVEVALDGKPRRTLTVTENRLYELVRLPRAGDHVLTLRLGPGTEAYAFTFG